MTEREPFTIALVLQTAIDAVFCWIAKWSMQILIIGGFFFGLGFGLAWMLLRNKKIRNALFAVILWNCLHERRNPHLNYLRCGNAFADIRVQDGQPKNWAKSKHNMR